MRSVIEMAFVIVLVSAGAGAQSILIVADEWPQMEVFGPFLESEAGYTVEKVVQEEMPKDLSGYYGVVEFVHGALQDGPAQQLIDYANGGGRLLVIHHGVSSGKKKTKGWYSFLGMELDRTEGAKKYYRWKGDVDLTVANLNPRHFITSHKVSYPEVITYRSSDQPTVPAEAPAMTFEKTEVFINHQFTDGREKTVLFGFRYEDAKTGEVFMQDRAGWYKPAGKGWVFYFQPGHAVSDFEHKDYCQILLNCFLWQPAG